MKIKNNYFLHLHEVVEGLYFYFSCLSVCVCVCLCVCVCVCPFVNKMPIEPLHRFFLYNSLITSLLWISALLCRIIMKFSSSLRYALGRFVFEFDKIWMGDDVIVTSFKFSANNCPYFKFHWTYKFHTWYKCTTT